MASDYLLPAGDKSVQGALPLVRHGISVDSVMSAHDAPHLLQVIQYKVHLQAVSNLRCPIVPNLTAVKPEP